MSADNNAPVEAAEADNQTLRPVPPGDEPTKLMYGLRKPMIHNVIATVNLGCHIELRKVVLHIRSAEYNPKRFPGAVMRLREPRVTCLIFGTGKMVCTGARSEAECHLGARKCARILQKIGFSFSGLQPITADFTVRMCLSSDHCNKHNQSFSYSTLLVHNFHATQRKHEG
ncbi:TATA-box-binding protein [Clonorchis sinensis]|uniref:TATA-box-binding protein n=1 Tax=Clonorchis sinensis TaxID=79923 RepID=G7Y6A8_CLOSI|nr:TATA-box-binding protein [Clonorchis sinensis]